MSSPDNDTTKKILLFLISLTAAVGLYCLLKLFGEGWPNASRGPLWNSFIVIYITLLISWYIVWKKRPWFSSHGAVLCILGYVIPSVPLILYLFVAGIVANDSTKIKRFSQDAVITVRQLTPLYWPNIDAPVGLRLDLSIRSPIYIAGEFQGPHIGRFTFASSEKKTCSSILEACLSSPEAWPLLPQAMLDEYSATSEVHYNLYPSNLAYLNTSAKLCLKTASPEATQNVHPIEASWSFITATKVKIDLSEHLTKEIRTSTRLDQIMTILNARYFFTQSELYKQGYRSCALERPNLACYCKI